MAERAPVSAEETLVRYDNPVLVTKQPEKPVSIQILLKINCLFILVLPLHQLACKDKDLLMMHTINMVIIHSFTVNPTRGPIDTTMYTNRS